MKRVGLVLACVFFAQSAFAGEADRALTEQVGKCFRPSVAIKKGTQIAVQVELDQAGELVDITANEYPKDGLGRVYVESLRRSLIRCAPYREFGAGVYTLTFGPETKSLDPFKD